MKNKTLCVISVFLSIFICICIVRGHAVAWADQLILFENRSPKAYKVIKSRRTLYSPGQTENLVVSSLKSGTYEGFEVTVNDDSSITVTGVNYENNVHIRLGEIRLPAGKYVLSDGGASEQIAEGYMYVYAAGQTFATLPGSSVFTTVSTSELYEVGILIMKGCQVDHITFYPMLAEGTEEKRFDPYYRTYGETEDAVCLYYVMDEISEGDLAIVKNSMSTDASRWSSLIYTDGTGMQMEDDEIRSGNISVFGIVTEKRN